MQPKVPDGRCKMSLGSKHQALESYDFAAGVQRMDFLIIPGLKTMVLAASTGDGVTFAPLPSMNIDKHVNFTYSQTVTNPGPPATGEAVFTQVPESRINHWRMVSAAVKFTLTNATDDDEGWWESCRTTLSTNEDIGMLAAGTPDQVGTFQSIAGGEPFPFIKPDYNMVNHTTYNSGRLKDIGKRSFQLHAHKKYHPFVEVGETVEFTSTGELLRSKRDYNPLLDDTYDVIYLRVHGKASTTKLIAHSVSNQEQVYDEQSIMARAMTKGAKMVKPTPMSTG